MALLDNYFGVHGAALGLRSKRLDMLASNIANAATPGYKARDIDFDAALRQAGGKGALAATAGGHYAEAGTGGPDGNTKYRVPIQPSVDGNTVELSTEQSLFGENAVRYQTTLSFLNGRISTLMSALKGE